MRLEITPGGRTSFRSMILVQLPADAKQVQTVETFLIFNISRLTSHIFTIFLLLHHFMMI